MSLAELFSELKTTVAKFLNSFKEEAEAPFEIKGLSLTSIEKTEESLKNNDTNTVNVWLGSIKIELAIEEAAYSTSTNRMSKEKKNYFSEINQIINKINLEIKELEELNKIQAVLNDSFAKIKSANSAYNFPEIINSLKPYIERANSDKTVEKEINNRGASPAVVDSTGTRGC